MPRNDRDRAKRGLSFLRPYIFGNENSFEFFFIAENAVLQLSGNIGEYLNEQRYFSCSFKRPLNPEKLQLNYKPKNQKNKRKIAEF